MKPLETSPSDPTAAKSPTPDDLLRALRSGEVQLKQEFRLTQRRTLLFDRDGGVLAVITRPEGGLAKAVSLLAAIPALGAGFVVALAPMQWLTGTALWLYSPVVPVAAAIWAAALVVRLFLPRPTLRPGTEHGDPPEVFRAVGRRGTLFRQRCDVVAGAEPVGTIDTLIWRSLRTTAYEVRSPDGALRARVIAAVPTPGRRGVAEDAPEPSGLEAYGPPTPPRPTSPSPERHPAWESLVPAAPEPRTDGFLGRIRPGAPVDNRSRLIVETAEALDPRLLLACYLLARR